MAYLNSTQAQDSDSGGGQFSVRTVSTSLKDTMKLVVFVGALLLADAQADRQSDGYKRAAEHLHKFMNSSVDPCNDFYEYTCGNYKVTFVEKAKNTNVSLEHL